MTWDRAIWLLAGLSVPLIILFHLLARRLREVVVPSLYLWRRLLENEKPSLRLRRMAADLILILQLLTAILTVTALAGPRFSGSGSRITGPSVLVLDTSAGMAASTAEGRTRMEQAIGEAEELVRAKTLNAEMAILAGGRNILPVSGFTRSRRDLLEALGNLEVSHEPGSPETLLKAARALASSRRGSRIIFITDGAFDVQSGFAGDLESIIVGGSEPAGNVGIIAFDIRSLPGGGRELILAARSFSRDTRELNLEVSLGGQLLVEEDFVLGPGEILARNIVWQEDLEGRLIATVGPRKGSSSAGGPGGDTATDAFAADDRAFAVLSSDHRVNVNLYTPGNWFLETLLASHPGLSLTVYSMETGFDPALVSEPPNGADLLVFDRIAVPSAGTEAVFAVYPFESGLPGLPLEELGLVEAPNPVTWNGSHPVMENVDFDRISISRGAVINPVPGTRILAASETGPLVLAGSEGGQRWTALSFNLLTSSLPVSPAFPILVSNTLNWLVPVDINAAASMARTGDPWPVPVAGLIDPEGSSSDIGDGDRIPAGPGQAGFWTILSDRGEYEIGVNLLDAGESNLENRWQGAGFADQDISREDNRGDTEDSLGLISPTSTYPYSRPLLTVLLMLALLGLLAEWYAQVRVWRRR